MRTPSCAFLLECRGSLAIPNRVKGLRVVKKSGWKNFSHLKTDRFSRSSNIKHITLCKKKVNMKNILFSKLIGFTYFFEVHARWILESITCDRFTTAQRRVKASATSFQSLEPWFPGLGHSLECPSQGGPGFDFRILSAYLQHHHTLYHAWKLYQSHALPIPC